MSRSIVAPKNQLEFAMNGSALIAAYTGHNVTKLALAACRPLVALSLKATGQIVDHFPEGLAEPTSSIDGQYADRLERLPPPRSLDSRLINIYTLDSDSESTAIETATSTAARDKLLVDIIEQPLNL